MIYPQTMLTVADNTGAKKIMCIRLLGGNRKYGNCPYLSLLSAGN